MKPPRNPLAGEAARIDLLDLDHEVGEDVADVARVLGPELGEHVVREARDLALRADAVLDERLRIAHVDLRGYGDGPLLLLRGEGREIARVWRDPSLGDVRSLWIPPWIDASIVSMTCGVGMGTTLVTLSGMPCTCSILGSFWTPARPVLKPCCSQAIFWISGSFSASMSFDPPRGERDEGMGAPYRGHGVEDAHLVLHLRPDVRLLPGELDDLVLVADDDGIGADAGAQVLVEEDSRRVLHVAQFREDGADRGKRR